MCCIYNNVNIAFFNHALVHTYTLIYRTTVGSCDVYIKVYKMQCKKVSFTAEETYLWWERGTNGALFRSPGCDLSPWNTRFLLSGEPQLNDRDRHNGGVVLDPTQEGQSQQLSSREKMAPGMLCSSCYCWLMGIWEEGRWYWCREWHSEAEAAACFVIWKRSTLFGAGTEFWRSTLGSQEGNNLSLLSHAPRGSVFVLWMFDMKHTGCEGFWYGLNRAARVCLYQSFYLFIFGAEGLSVAYLCL